jgi:hypothetical protein
MNIQNLTGQTLGQYELQQLLGFGGMGVTYRAHQKSLERDVAVKVLGAALASESGYIERFYREAKTAASLEHGHIVPVYDYGVQGDISYVVMRLLPGGSLEDRIKQHQENNQAPPSLGEVSVLLNQLASALDYAHARGVIHRDIKPANIMFDTQGTAYIVDFGIAKLMESTTSFTATGTPMGTPLFMPPEQWRSEDLTPAADQYALAVTVYSLLTGGQLPFEATTPYGMMHKHLNEDPIPPHERRPDIPPALNGVLARAMHKTPAERYPTVTAFAEAFKEAIVGQTGEMTNFFTAPVRSMSSTGSGLAPSTVTVTITQPAYKSPVMWVLAAALVVVLGVLGYLLLAADDGGDDNSGAVTQTFGADAVRQQTAVADARTQAVGNLTATAAQWTPTSTIDPTERARMQGLQTQVVVVITETAEAIRAAPTLTARAVTAEAATAAAAEALTATAESATVEAATAAAAEARTATADVNQANTATAEAAIIEVATAGAAQARTATADVNQANTAMAEAAQATPTPAPTLTPTPTPRPNLRALYTDNEFMLINISSRTLDISRLVFERTMPDDTVRRFAAREWDRPAAIMPPDNMTRDRCYQLFTAELTEREPALDVCAARLGWFSTGISDRHFWTDGEPGATFEVIDTATGQQLAACRLAAGECEFFCESCR